MEIFRSIFSNFSIIKKQPSILPKLLTKTINYKFIAFFCGYNGIYRVSVPLNKYNIIIIVV